METVHLQSNVGNDGVLRLSVPLRLPPGPVEVKLEIQPKEQPTEKLRWRDLYGTGKDIWGDEDAQEYVNRLRDEWEREST